MTIYDDAIAIRDATKAKFDAIRNDERLSPAGKQRLMAPHLLAMKKQLTDLQWKSDTYRDLRAKELKRATFGTPGTDALTRMDHRDAVGRAAKVTDPREGEFQMRRALEHGDTIMAKALAQSAVDNGWRSALDLYTEAHPETADALNEIQSLAATPHTKFNDAMYFHADVPQELAKMPEHQIEALAAEPAVI